MGSRSHRDIPSDRRQLSLFRCPRVSPRLSASHGPSTSSSQQLLKPEKRRKWKPGVSCVSVRATDLTYPVQDLEGPPGRARQKSHGPGVLEKGEEAGEDWKHWAPFPVKALSQAHTRHMCVLYVLVVSADHMPDLGIGLALFCPDPTPHLSCSSLRLLRVWKLRDLGSMACRREHQEKA